MPNEELTLTERLQKVKEKTLSERLADLKKKPKKKVPTEKLLTGAEEPVSGIPLETPSIPPKEVEPVPEEPTQPKRSDFFSQTLEQRRTAIQREQDIIPGKVIETGWGGVTKKLPDKTISGIPLDEPEKLNKDKNDFKFWNWIGRKLETGVDRAAAAILRTPETIYDVIVNGFNLLLEGQDYLTGLAGLPKARKIATTEELGKMHGIKNIPAERLEAYAEFISAIDEKYQKPITESIVSGNYKDAAIAIAGSMAESFPYTAGIIMASLAGAGIPAMIAGITTTMTAQRKQELLEREDLTETQKNTNALIYGLAESIDVWFGAGGTVGRAIRNVVKKEGAKKAKQFAIDIVDSLIKNNPYLQPLFESVQEGITQYIQNLGDIIILDEKKSPMEGVSDAMIVGLAMGGLGGGIVQGVKTVSKLTEPTGIPEIPKAKPVELEESDFEFIEKAAADTDYYETLTNEFTQMVEEGTLTKEEGAQLKKTLDETIEIINKFPIDFDVKKKNKAYSLIKEKQELELENETLDEMFQEKNNNRITVINEELKALQPEVKEPVVLPGPEVKEEPIPPEVKKEPITPTVKEEPIGEISKLVTETETFLKEEGREAEMTTKQIEDFYVRQQNRINELKPQTDETISIEIEKRDGAEGEKLDQSATDIESKGEKYRPIEEIERTPEITDSEINEYIRESEELETDIAEIAGKEYKEVPPEEKPLPPKEKAEKIRQFAIDMVKTGQVPTGKIEIYEARVDYEMSGAEITKAVSDIKKGNLETVPAKKLIEKHEEFYELGGLPIIIGTGGKTVRGEHIPLREEIDLIEEAKALQSEVAAKKEPTVPPEVKKEVAKKEPVEDIRKYTTPTEEKYGYIQEEGKEKRELTRKKFEAEQAKKFIIKEPITKEAKPVLELVKIEKKAKELGEENMESNYVQIESENDFKNEWIEIYYDKKYYDELTETEKTKVDKEVKENYKKEGYYNEELDDFVGTYEDALRSFWEKKPAEPKIEEPETVSEGKKIEEAKKEIAEREAKEKPPEKIPLETKIRTAITDIKEGKISPKESGIVEMFKEIKETEPETFTTLQAEYKPIITEYKEKQVKLEEAEREKGIKKADQGIADALDDITTAIGGKASIMGEARPKVIKALKNLVENIAIKYELKGEALYEKVKAKIKDIFKEDFYVDFFDKNRSEVMGEYEEEIVREKPTTKQYSQFAEKMMRLGEKKTKQATDQMRKEVIKFVGENIKDLEKISGRSMPALMKKISAVRAGKPKALESAIEYIEKIATGQAEKERLSGINEIRKKIDNELKQATKKETGRLKAKRYSQQGIDAIKEIKESFDLTIEQAGVKAADLEARIAAEEMRKNQDLTDSQKIEAEENITQLQKQAEYANLYSDLNNKSQEGIDHVKELLKQEFTDLKEDLKEKRKERSEKWKAKKDKMFKEIGEPTEVELEKEPKKPTILASYLAKQLSPKNLLTQLGNAYRQGIEIKDSILEQLAKNLELGTEKYVSTELGMKKRLKQGIKDFFGTELKLRRELNKESKIYLIEEIKDAKGNIIEVKKVTKKVDHANLAHLWASYTSESNHIYTQRIADVNRRLRLTPEEWLRIDELLPDNIKNFTDWIVKDYLPPYYDLANKVYYDRNFANLPKLPDYLFVNAKKVRDASAALTNIYNVSTYKPFTAQRVYGEYNLRGNNIYEGLLRHIDHYSKFVGLSESIAEVNSLLNSREISRLIELRGLQPYKRSLEHMMTVGISGEARIKWADTLFHNFVGSKVLMNYALFPKQTVSFFTIFDPKYVPTSEVIKSIYNINTNKQAYKRAINILSQSGQFSTRNIREIETLIKKGNPTKAQLIIDEIANKMEDKVVAKSIKTFGEFLWNPTQKGDRFTIRLGGIPLIDAAYRVEFKKLKDEKVKTEDAEKMAASEALYKFNEWMDGTQQSMRWTGKSEFQTGLYRYAAPFMNSLMSYSRKIITSYRNIYRGMRGERERMLKKTPNMNPHVAIIRSLKGVSGADLQRLFIYQMTLPVLWSAVSTGGRSIINLWSDDDEKRYEAFRDLTWDMTLGWTKGLYAVGFIGDFLYGYATGRRYGRNADNFIRLFDDILNVSVASIDVVSGHVKLAKAETDKEYEKQKLRVIKAYMEAGEFISATLGLPSVTIGRVADITMDEFYDKMAKKVLRIYGMRRKSLEEWYGFDQDEKPKAKKPKSAIRPPRIL